MKYNIIQFQTISNHIYKFIVMPGFSVLQYIYILMNLFFESVIRTVKYKHWVIKHVYLYTDQILCIYNQNYNSSASNSGTCPIGNEYLNNILEVRGVKSIVLQSTAFPLSQVLVDSFNDQWLRYLKFHNYIKEIGLFIIFNQSFSNVHSAFCRWYHYMCWCFESRWQRVQTLWYCFGSSNAGSYWKCPLEVGISESVISLGPKAIDWGTIDFIPRLGRVFMMSSTDETIASISIATTRKSSIVVLVTYAQCYIYEVIDI